MEGAFDTFKSTYLMPRRIKVLFTKLSVSDRIALMVL